MNLPDTAAVDQGHCLDQGRNAGYRRAAALHGDHPPRLLHPQRHPPPSGTSATIRDVCSTGAPAQTAPVSRGRPPGCLDPR